jgi:hypothetical protein
MPGIAPNVQWAAIATFIAACIEHGFAAYGYTLPPDIAAGLPGFIAIVVAHIYDVRTGDNQARPVPNPQATTVKPDGNGS